MDCVHVSNLGEVQWRCLIVAVCMFFSVYSSQRLCILLICLIFKSKYLIFFHIWSCNYTCIAMTMCLCLISLWLKRQTPLDKETEWKLIEFKTTIHIQAMGFHYDQVKTS